MKKTNLLRKSFFYLAAQKARLIISLFITLISCGTSLLVALLLQQVIDIAAGNENAYPLWITLIITVVALGIDIVSNLISYYTEPKLFSSAMENYRNTAFSLLSEKHIGAFKGESTSLYLSSLTAETETIEKNYLKNINPLFRNIILFFGSFAFMLYYSRLLTAIVVGFAIIPVLASFIAGNKLESREKKVSEKREKYTSSLKEALEGFSVIKSFKAEERLVSVIKSKAFELQSAVCSREKTQIIIFIISYLSGSITQFGVFFVSAYLALIGKPITAGTIIAFVQLMNYIINPIGEVPRIISEMRSALSLIDKLDEALHENPDGGGKFEIKELNRGIKVKNLSFSYEEGKDILNDISFNFEAGKAYAVVGGSGSGKSTLLSVLSGVNENYTGSVLYDETDVRDIKSEALFEIVSSVSQNVFVFNGSIQDNITMFGKYSRDKIERATSLSGLSSLLEEKGEGYICGENGQNLSGGEKQRLSVARSLMLDSKVLLADEATSSLDKENATLITDSILGLNDILRIVVTHSLDKALLERYDCIIALKNGKIIESGSFAELLERKEYFYSLYSVSN